MVRRVLIVTALAALTVMAVLSLQHLYRSKLPKPDHVAEKLSRIQVPRPELERPCGDLDSKRVFLVIGQSNAANHGETPGSSEHGLVWAGGKCYALVDPLPGGTGRGGSIWTRFADLWFDRTGESTVFVVLAVDATTVGEWVSHPKLVARFGNLLTSLRDHTVELDAVLWQQGEADAQRKTSRQDYISSSGGITKRLRPHDSERPLFVAKSTRCRSSKYEPVRLAVKELIENWKGVYAGPDADLIDLAYRFDGCHFSDIGLRHSAILWIDSIEKAFYQ